MTAAVPALNPAPHQAFSTGRVGALASNTVLELVRLKVFYILILFAAVAIAASLVGVRFTFQDEFQLLKDVSLGGMSIFSWLLAVLATAMLLPKDLEDRTLYTILAKPVPRFEYLLGKLLGVLALLLVAVLLMSAFFLAVLYYHQQSELRAIDARYPGKLIGEALEHFNAEKAEVYAATFTPNLIAGIVAIFIKAALCASLTLFLSTFSTS